MDADVAGSISNIGLNVGIYTDHRVNGKHLTLEINPKRGNLQGVEFTVVYTLTNKDSRISTVTLTDRDFDYEFVYTGFTGRTWTTLNYVLDDPTIYIKEISIEGRLKIDEEWYRMKEKKSFTKNWQWINCQLFLFLIHKLFFQFFFSKFFNFFNIFNTFKSWTDNHIWYFFISFYKIIIFYNIS